MATSYRDTARPENAQLLSVSVHWFARRQLATVRATIMACALLALLSPLLPVAAAQSGVPVPAAIRPLLPDAALAGGGSYRWFGLKLYDARLWATRKAVSPDNWEATPIALELVYARTLYGERIAKASIDEMRQLGMGTATQHAAWLEAMKRVFPDVKEGTQLIGLYQPGGPTQFLRDGQPAGEIADPDFGKAFFAIWLHPGTSAAKLRGALFGIKP